MDSVSVERRSEIMGRVKSANTRPEVAARKLFHSLGYRVRLRPKGAPGRPDFGLPRWKTVVLVHGCFWHRHPGCPNTRTPKSRVEFWEAKFDENVERDSRYQATAQAQGWRVFVVWECELRHPDRLAERIRHAFPADQPRTVHRGRRAGHRGG